MCRCTNLHTDIHIHIIRNNKCYFKMKIKTGDMFCRHLPFQHLSDFKDNKEATAGKLNLDNGA